MAHWVVSITGAARAVQILLMATKFDACNGKIFKGETINGKVSHVSHTSEGTCSGLIGGGGGS